MYVSLCNIWCPLSCLSLFYVWLIPPLLKNSNDHLCHFYRNYCAFSGLGESTSVMFCGSFHASAMYLLFPPVSATPSRIPFLGAGMKYEYLLSVAAPSHELLLLVREADGSVRERLADCEFSWLAWPTFHSQSHRQVWQGYYCSARGREVRRAWAYLRTFIARHFGADDVADLAAGGEVGH